MFRKLSRLIVNVNSNNNLEYVFRNLTSVANKNVEPISNTLASNEQDGLTKTNTTTPDVVSQKPHRTQFSELSEYLRPGAVTSLYINKSDSLQQLLKLGVKFYKIEKNPEAFTFILGLKFEDFQDHVLFLRDLQLTTDQIGEVITKNPFLLKEHVDDLQVRINYLQFKKFTDEMILRIVQTNTSWLSYSTKEIDDRLGFFQNNFLLRGNEVRGLATKSPKLITYSLEKVKLNIFVLKEEMGFDQKETKTILLDKPKLFMMDQNKLLRTFEYLHKTMKIPLERIVEMPESLTCRQKRLMQRHLFLAELGRAQYDPKKPNYVGLTTLVSGTDSYFATEVAKSSVQVFNTFLKSL